MHDRYHDLKKRCKRYYLKYIFIYMTVLVTLALVVFFGFLFFDSKQNKSDVTLHPSVEKTKLKQPRSPISTDKNSSQEKNKLIKVASSNTTKEDIALKDSNDTVKTDKKVEENPDKENATDNQKIQTKHLTPIYNFEIDALYQKYWDKKQEKIQKQEQEDIKQEQNKQQIINEEVKKIEIGSSKVDSIEQKIVIFNQRPHFEKAFVIAQYYYDKQEYEKVISWCKKADKLKPADENVFELYALSLYYLGKSEQAVSLINYFLSMKVSDDLQSLKAVIEQKKL